MITSELYKFFLKAELPRSLWRSYRTLSGTVVMRTARAMVKILDREFETFVEVPLFGEGKLLLGREIFNEMTIVADGKRKETCLSNE